MRAARQLRVFRRDEDGAILPFVAIASPLFILMLAFTVDMDIGRLTANKLQISADAAALAAIQQIPNRSQVQSTAISYARKNYNTDNANARDITNAANVEMGYWDDTTRTFYPGDESSGFFGQRWDAVNDVFVTASVPAEAVINSVWVRTRRDETNNNPLPSAFASFVGIESFDIKRTSIAVARSTPGDDCRGGGILSDVNVEMEDDNRLDDFCVYGRDYVELGEDNDVNEGTYLVMENEADYRPTVGNDDNDYFDREDQIISNTDGDWGVGMPSLVDGVAGLMKGGALPNGIVDQFGVSGFSTRSGDVSSNNGSQFDANRLYYVDGDVSLRGWHQNMFIVASGDIEIEEDAVVFSSFLLAEGDLEVEEDVWIGRALACLSSSPVTFDTYLWSGGDFSSESDVRYFGAQIVTKGSFTLDEDNNAFGLFVEASGTAEVGEDNRFDRCGTGVQTSIGDLPKPFQGGLRVALRN